MNEDIESTNRGLTYAQHWAKALYTRLENTCNIKTDSKFLQAIKPKLLEQGLWPDDVLVETGDNECEVVTAEDQIRYWFHGVDVPRSQEAHAVVMDLLDLPNPYVKRTKAALRKMNGKADALKFSQQLHDLWSPAYEELRGTELQYYQLPNSVHTAPNGGNKSRVNGHNSSNLAPHSKDGNTGERYYDFTDNAYNSYQGIADANNNKLLEEIQTHTDNFHEYVHVSRLLRGLVLRELIEEGVTGVSGYEHGGRFPEYKTLNQLSKVLFPNDAGKAQKLETLWYRGIYNNAVAARQNNEIDSYAVRLTAFPKFYWESVLDKAKDPVGWDNRPQGERALWHDYTLDMSTRGGYFKALCYYLGDQLDDSFFRELGLSHEHGQLEFIWQNQGILDESEKFHMVLNGLRHYADSHPEFARHYSEETFRALPTDREEGLEMMQDKMSWVDRSAVKASERGVREV